jgi:uncharacterized membrane protein YidH (DUF202 family)
LKVFEWSKQQEAAALAKATIRRERKERDLRAGVAQIRVEDVDRAASDLNARIGDSPSAEAVRSVVEGDVYTYVPEAGDADRQLEIVNGELFSASTDLEILKPEFVRAWADRNASIQATQAGAGRDRRIQTSSQSGLTVLASLVVLILLETLFQRRPVERIIRTNFPELSNNWVNVIAVAASIAIVGLATVGLYQAAKTWGEFSIRVVRVDDTVRDVGGNIVGETISPISALIYTFVALILQVGLFFLRFQTGTSDTTTKNTLYFVSFLIMFSAATVALLEYRRASSAEASRALPPSNRDEVIRRFTTLHRAVNAKLPQEKIDIERRKYQAILRFLRELQRIGDKNGQGTRQALSVLVAEYVAKLDGLKDVVYEAATATDLAPISIPIFGINGSEQVRSDENSRSI